MGLGSGRHKRRVHWRINSPAPSSWRPGNSRYRFQPSPTRAKAKMAARYWGSCLLPRRRAQLDAEQGVGLNPFNMSDNRSFE